MSRYDGAVVLHSARGRRVSCTHCGEVGVLVPPWAAQGVAEWHLQQQHPEPTLAEALKEFRAGEPCPDCEEEA